MSDGPIFPPVRGPHEDEPTPAGNHTDSAANSSNPPRDLLGASTADAPDGAGDDLNADASIEVAVDPDVTADPDTIADTEDEQAETRPKIPWWAWALIALGAIAITVAIVIAVNSGGKDPGPAPTVTVTAEAPIPTGTPIEKEADGSLLYESIPAMTNQFVLAVLEPIEAWSDERDAIEAYAGTYVGPSTIEVDGGNPPVQLQVTVGQWATAEEATTAATALADETVGTDTVLSDVQVGDERVGSLWAPAEGLPEDSTQAALVWTNDTAVVLLQGAGDELQRFHEGYGL